MGTDNGTALCDHGCAGQGRWLFADGLSFYEGSYEAGQRKQGKLVTFNAATKKPAESYTGR